MHSVFASPTVSGAYVVLADDGGPAGPWLHGPYGDIEQAEDHAARLRHASRVAHLVLDPIIGWDELKSVTVLPSHQVDSNPLASIAEHFGQVDLEGYGLDDASIADELIRDHSRKAALALIECTRAAL